MIIICEKWCALSREVSLEITARGKWFSYIQNRNVYLHTDTRTYVDNHISGKDVKYNPTQTLKEKKMMLPRECVLQMRPWCVALATLLLMYVACLNADAHSVFSYSRRLKAPQRRYGAPQSTTSFSLKGHQQGSHQGRRRGGYGRGRKYDAPLKGEEGGPRVDRQEEEGCRYYCRTPKGDTYCCESDSEPITRPAVKGGVCPPVEGPCSLPPSSSSFVVVSCSNDGRCPAHDKCCFDRCQERHVCVPPSPF